MTTAFGALVRYRRRTLALTPDQLALRMTARGHAVDIPALEDGHTASQGPGFLAALAGALEWRVGLLRVAWELSAVEQDASFADKIVFLYARDEVTMIREELDDLHDLHQVLMQWADDLTNRACVLRSRTRAAMADPPFNA